VKIWKTQRALVLVILTAIVLAGMAVLQYRWVGELTAFEYQRTQRNLRVATEGLARDFGREFRRIRAGFEIGRSRDVAEEIDQEYREWADSSDYPDLIREVYWVEADGLGPSLLQRVGSRLNAVEWPALLAPLREKVMRGTDAGARGRSRPSRSWTEPLGEHAIAMVIPQDDRPVQAWAIVLLDRDILAGHLFPSIVDQNFGSAEQRDYDIWIAEEGENGSLLYASNHALPIPHPKKADVGRNLDGADWVVSARHHTGSVEAFVNQYRRRNLFLGIGTVIVLGASFLFLLVATRRAQGLAERQMEFVAGVSHELRTPIAGISSLSQNLADGVVHDPDHVVRYGESINTESRRLRDMVDKVLHFAAVRSGQYHYSLQPVDLRWIIENELETLRHHDEGKLAPVLNIEGELPPALGDEQALRSLVRNLVSNAIKFGGENRPITVSARRVEREGKEEIELQVEDYGGGIASSDLPHIFEPFFRGKGARSAQVGGSGLGLSLAREIVKAHNGRINVATRSGEGSTFRVSLPVAAQEL
jgi:signal transduction histidine kinase